MRPWTLSLVFAAGAFGVSGCGVGLNLGAKPQLYNLGITIKALSGGYAGDLWPNANNPTPQKPFYAFKSSSKGFVYYVKADAEIVSPIAGTVRSLSPEPTDGEYTVVLAPSPASEWTVELHHVTALAVEAGARVGYGDLLGSPGATDDAAQGVMELRVLSQTEYYCPMKVLSAGVRDALNQTVQQAIIDIEGNTGGSTSFYDEASMETPGCEVDVHDQ